MVEAPLQPHLREEIPLLRGGEVRPADHLAREGHPRLAESARVDRPEAPFAQHGLGEVVRVRDRVGAEGVSAGRGASPNLILPNLQVSQKKVTVQ